MDQKLHQLQERLLAAEQRAEEERQRAEAAERQQQEERRRAEGERQRAERAEEQTRQTTLDEYIAATHFSVFTHPTVETDKDLTSKGTITNPRHKLCPTSVRPWPDLLEQQHATLGTLYDTFPADKRRFEPRSVLHGLGQRISKRRISDEKSLEYFLHTSVEDLVRLIIDQLKAAKEVKRAFGLGDGVIFENHPNALSDVADEVIDRQASSNTPQTPDQGRGPSQIRPDQICVYRSKERTMVYVSEYKAPHKLTASHLRVGLHPMDIYKDVVNRKTILTAADPEGRFRYHSERLTASAPTLYYHLAEPGPEVADHPTDFHPCMTVGQYLAFGLMALGAPGEVRIHSQGERNQAIRGSKRWAGDFETTLRSIPNGERLPPAGSSYAPTAYVDVMRSPHLLRRRRPRRVERDSPSDKPIRKDPSESSDDDLPETPSPTDRRRGLPGQGQGPRRSERNLARRPREGGGQDRQYCTQRCLLGLVRGNALDKGRPNVMHHRQDRTDGHHPIDHGDFLRLLRCQLEKSLDDGVVKLSLGGSRGVLFQVTLLAYGYTFVSKGTIPAFIPDLQHEETVYEQLKQTQSITVPVYLGAIDLRDMGRTYYYDHRVYIKYMMFLSWAGTKLDRSVSVDRVVGCLRAIHREGIVHGDVRGANVLSDPTTGRVMLVDFERASIVKSIRRPLGQVVPNKRAWDHGRKGKGDDISAAIAVFSG
ncbi:hypothetical protein GGR52DRAFT_581939 [Hypoxylon sp. FL1284]|nr:hypothetical protein GGR52DRAFT_581939 [Hypoxylon sp. FL1284]